MKKFPFLLLMAAMFVFSAQARAATFVVSSDVDSADAAPGNGVCADSTGRCTLRAAVQEANAFAGADTINFAASLSGYPVTLALGEIAITENLTINGLGANQSTVSGGGVSRIFFINAVEVTLRGLRLINGNSVGAVSSGNGGAIYAYGGKLTLDSVSIEKNRAKGNGGGVYFNYGTVFCIINSAFLHNIANTSCGGLYVSGGNLLVANTTFSGNRTNGAGGGVCSEGAAVFRNVTIAENSASAAGGVYVNGGSFNVGNTLIVNNASAVYPDIRQDGTGIIVSAGYNLLTNVNGVPAGTFAVAGDIVTNNFVLGALTNNGGTTWTHAILAGSQAHNTGSNDLAIDPCTNSPLTTDQRGPGFGRINGGRVDIGAYELQTPTAASVSVSGRVLSDDRRGFAAARAFVTITNQNGESQTVTTNAFGYYRFENVTVGATYIFTVSRKGDTFAPQAVTINEETENMNFVAQ